MWLGVSLFLWSKAGFMLDSDTDYSTIGFDSYIGQGSLWGMRGCSHLEDIIVPQYVQKTGSNVHYSTNKAFKDAQKLGCPAGLDQMCLLFQSGFQVQCKLKCWLRPLMFYCWCVDNTLWLLLQTNFITAIDSTFQHCTSVVHDSGCIIFCIIYCILPLCYILSFVPQ